MIKVVLFGLVVVGAMAQIPGFMGGFGGLDPNNLPEGTMDMLKNLKTTDIKKILENMPPKMMEMAEGMGLTQEQIKEAVNNLPEDFDMSAIMNTMGSNQGELNKKVGEMMQKESLGEFKATMSDMGMDLSEGPEGFKDQILPKITEMMGRELRNNGINIDNREDLRNNLHFEIRMMLGAQKGSTDEEVREMIKKKIADEMKEDGVEFDQTDVKGGLKKQLLGDMKEMGIDLDKNSLKEMMEKIMKTSENGNPGELVKKILPMLNVNV